MDAERWNRVERLLQSILDLPPAEHDAFLKNACAGDEARLREGLWRLGSRFEREERGVYRSETVRSITCRTSCRDILSFGSL